MNEQDGVARHESPYAAEMRRGSARLRFSRGVESQFQSEYAAHHRTRLRVGFLVAAAVYAVYILLRLGAEPAPVGDWLLLLRVAALGGLLYTVMASYLPALHAVVPSFTVASYALFGGALTAVEVLAQRHGIGRHYEGLILLSFHLYMFSGLLLRPALAAGAIILLSYALGGWAGGLAGAEWGYELLFLGLTHAIGGAALYSMERVERADFLRRWFLAELATLDSLTGLYNRIAFFKQLERTAGQAAREGVPLGLVLFDVDHFKAYNDRYGHVAGDACLRRVAERARDEFRRPLDVLGRYGGEEFVGVWYDVQPQTLRTLAEGLRAAVQALRIDNQDAPSGRITVSVGALAWRPREGESLPDFVERADRALYEAKDKGRNRVVVEVLATAEAPSGRARRAPGITSAG